jgi:hypothetical protein
VALPLRDRHGGGIRFPQREIVETALLSIFSMSIPSTMYAMATFGRRVGEKFPYLFFQRYEFRTPIKIVRRVTYTQRHDFV